jgi:hypothetical protein
MAAVEFGFSLDEEPPDDSWAIMVRGEFNNNGFICGALVHKDMFSDADTMKSFLYGQAELHLGKNPEKL